MSAATNWIDRTLERRLLVLEGRIVAWRNRERDGRYRASICAERITRCRRELNTLHVLVARGEGS